MPDYYPERKREKTSELLRHRRDTRNILFRGPGYPLQRAERGLSGKKKSNKMASNYQAFLAAASLRKRDRTARAWHFLRATHSNLPR